MRLEEISLNFQQQLRVCSNMKKYHGLFTREDEELALNAFESVFEDSTLSPYMIFEALTGDLEA